MPAAVARESYGSSRDDEGCENEICALWGLASFGLVGTETAVAVVDLRKLRRGGSSSSSPAAALHSLLAATEDYRPIVGAVPVPVTAHPRYPVLDDLLTAHRLNGEEGPKMRRSLSSDGVSGRETSSCSRSTSCDGNNILKCQTTAF